MIVDGNPFEGAFGHVIDRNFECEFCGRSLEERFGGVPPVECDSCAAEFKLLNDAGKLEL
jgi:hypothetical protein